MQKKFTQITLALLLLSTCPTAQAESKITSFISGLLSSSPSRQANDAHQCGLILRYSVPTIIGSAITYKMLKEQRSSTRDVLLFLVATSTYNSLCHTYNLIASFF